MRNEDFELLMDNIKLLQVSFSFRDAVTDPPTWTRIARTTVRAAIASLQRVPVLL